MTDYLLTLIRGDNRVVNLLIKELASPFDPIDLSGVDLWFYVKAGTRDPDTAAIIKKDPVDITINPDQTAPPTGHRGQATVAIVPADTNNLDFQYLDVPLLWEVQMRDGVGNIQTVGRGVLTIESDVILDPNPLVPTPGATFTYDPSTDAGRVRLLAQDFDGAFPIFSDLEITAFLELNQDDVFFAAASALEVIAANEVYVQKRIKILDLWTDGPREAERLIALAKSYRETGSAMSGPDEMFGWAEEIYNSWGANEKIIDDLLRQFA